MRVLIGSRFDLTKAGGVTTMVVGLSSGLQRLGHEVRLIKPDYSETSEVRGPEVCFWRIRMRPLRARSVRMRLSATAFWPQTMWTLYRMLRAYRPQIVNLHFVDGVWYYFVLLKRVLGFRLVLSSHGGDLRGVQGLRNRRLLSAWSSSIDAIIFCSSVLRDEVLSDCAELESKSYVVRNGVDVPVEAFGGDRRVNRIICIAHLFEWKGVDVLIDAFDRIARRHPDLTLDIAGQGPAAESLSRRVADLGLTDRISFLGAVPREEALKLIASSRILCLPSRQEGLPVVVLESMAARTPIVSTTAGGIPELLRPETDGLLVEPDDVAALASSLDRLLTDDALASTLAENAWQRFQENFTGETYIRRYHEIFARCVQGEGATSKSR